MTMTIATATPEAIAQAAALLCDGQLVAFPTETVYGLGADATSDAAVGAVFAAKGRPANNPLIAHVADLAAARREALFDDRAERLAERFWPGPLTLVLRRSDSSQLAPGVSAGLPTVALRVPDHPVAVALLHHVGRPIAAPSANPSGRLSPTTANHVAESLGDRVALILDGGPCPVGLESTVVGLAGEARLLRPGGLPRTAIEAEIGALAAATDDVLHAPGMMTSHYAPALPLRLDAEHPRPGEAFLAFGPCADATLNLSPSCDLDEAAANLYAMLHALDRPEYTAIAVMPICGAGAGTAINDRLRRGAAAMANDAKQARG
jgi:L-threonylcarbamoyladenylate synthase